MVFKWRDDYIEPFLDQCRQHECLWNVGIDSYKNRETREKAYESMRSALNFPGLSVDDIKTKIKTVRTNYKSEYYANTFDGHGRVFRSHARRVQKRGMNRHCLRKTRQVQQQYSKMTVLKLYKRVYWVLYTIIIS